MCCGALSTCFRHAPKHPPTSPASSCARKLQLGSTLQHVEHACVPCHANNHKPTQTMTPPTSFVINTCNLLQNPKHPIPFSISPPKVQRFLRYMHHAHASHHTRSNRHSDMCTQDRHTAHSMRGSTCVCIYGKGRMRCNMLFTHVLCCCPQHTAEIVRCVPCTRN